MDCICQIDVSTSFCGRWKTVRGSLLRTSLKWKFLDSVWSCDVLLQAGHIMFCPGWLVKGHMMFCSLMWVWLWPAENICGGEDIYRSLGRVRHHFLDQHCCTELGASTLGFAERNVPESFSRQSNWVFRLSLLCVCLWIGLLESWWLSLVIP